MTESILTSVKKYIGIAEMYEHYDADIIMYINSIFNLQLHQLGVTPDTGFAISDKTTTWDEYGTIKLIVEPVKAYVKSKVKLEFDPPQSTAALEALKQSIAEYEWRICMAAETVSKEENQNE